MNKKGQNFLEYALLVGCIALALTAMQVYFKRGIQGVIKSTHDDLVVPVEDATGVNGQIYGMADELLDGQPAYVQNGPITRTQDQEIVTTERARGERGFVINQDDSRIRSDITTSMEMGDAMDYSLSAQGFNPRSTESGEVDSSTIKTASESVSTPAVIKAKIEANPTKNKAKTSGTTSKDSSANSAVAEITQEKIELWQQYTGATVTPYSQLPPPVAKPYVDPGAGTEHAFTAEQIAELRAAN
jgi:Flp pilus assembly pilin Flp